MCEIACVRRLRPDLTDDPSDRSAAVQLSNAALCSSTALRLSNAALCPSTAQRPPPPPPPPFSAAAPSLSPVFPRHSWRMHLKTKHTLVISYMHDACVFIYKYSRIDVPGCLISPAAAAPCEASLLITCLYRCVCVRGAEEEVGGARRRRRRRRRRWWWWWWARGCWWCARQNTLSYQPPQSINVTHRSVYERIEDCSMCARDASVLSESAERCRCRARILVADVYRQTG